MSCSSGGCEQRQSAGNNNQITIIDVTATVGIVLLKMAKVKLISGESEKN